MIANSAMKESVEREKQQTNSTHMPKKGNQVEAR